MLKCASVSIPRVAFHRADMHDFHLEERFDAVTCMYNSINQTLTNHSVRSVLGRVRLHLRPGGWFLFDFVCDAGFRASWDADEIVRLDDQLCQLRYRYDSARGMASCLVSIADLRSGGPSLDFEIRQRPLEVAELRAELSRAGFTVKAIHPVRNAAPEKGRYAVLAKATATPAEPVPSPNQRVERRPREPEMAGARFVQVS